MNDLHTLGKAMRDALSELEAVLCDPEGRAAIEGSDADLAHIDSALNKLRAIAAEAAFDKALAETPAAPPAPEPRLSDKMRRRLKEYADAIKSMETGEPIGEAILLLLETTETPAAPPAPADVGKSDLTDWLVLAASHPNTPDDLRGFFTEAAAALTAQAARVAELERVLAPFTKYYDLNDCHERDDDDVLEVPVRDLRAAADLAAPETPASGEGWMPIETAPKDGTLVLLFCRYENPSDDAVHIGSWSYAINSDEYDCWWSKQADDEVVPTFWKPYTRPLPAPPKEGV